MAFLLKIAIFSPMLLINKGLFFDQTKYYSTQKKRLFQMAYFKFHEKNYWESLKLTDLKINPLRENHAHFISCKPPHKTHPREYFGTTLWFIQITTSAVEKSQILSVAFHLSTTVLGKGDLVCWCSVGSVFEAGSRGDCWGEFYKVMCINT